MLSRIFFRNVFLSLTALLVLNACRVGKEYSQPPVLLPEQFTTKSFADTSSIADIRWKSFFNDAQLLQLIDSGIAKNHDLLVAITRIEIAQQQVLQTAFRNLPTVDLQITGQYNRPSKNSLNGLSVNNFLNKSHVENYLAIVNLSWEADIWGKLSRQKDATVAG
ncbi:MAG: TolC family protein, partial [Gemmatimonadaceae bacterium]|nr:TolC family protein [Chitinophagaceae bacterium]